MKRQQNPAHIIDVDFLPPEEFTKRLPDDEIRVFDLLGQGTLQGGPFFGDDRWDLHELPGWPAGHAPSLTILDFSGIPALWRPLSKLLAVVELDPVRADIEFKLDPIQRFVHFPRASEPISVKDHVRSIHVATPAVLHSGETPFQGLNEGDWMQVQTLLRHGTEASRTGKITAATSPVLETTALVYATGLVLLDRVGSLFGWEDPFGSTPFNGVPVGQVFKRSQRFSFNSVRPNDDAEVAVAVADFFFRSGIAENIVDAAEFWFARPTETPSQDGKFSSAQRDHFAEFVSGVFDEHGAFPSNERGQIAWARLFRAAGFTTFGHHDPFTPRLAKTIQIDGATLPPGEFEKWLSTADRKEINLCPVKPVEVRSFVTGEMVPWCDPSDLEFSPQFNVKVGWVTWMAITLLHGECNLRLGDREVLDRDTCVEEFIDDSGKLCWRLHGWRKKNKLSNPERESFPISKTLYDAVRLIQRLHVVLGVKALPIRRLKKWATAYHLLAGDLLPANTKHPGNEVVSLHRQFVKTDVNSFMIHLSDRGIADHEPLDGVSPQEFRITALQNYRGATPHGRSVAAKMGAWASDRVERGYVGDVRTSSHAAMTATNSFNDAEDDLNIQRGATILELAQRNDLNQSGMNRMAEARHLHPEIDQIVHNKHLMTDGELRRALKRIGERDQRFHIGVFGACSYSPSRALCDGDGWLNPQECRPTLCHNSIQTRAHRANSELERRLFERIVEENPKSFLADRLKVLNDDRPKVVNEDGEEVYEFDGVDLDELRAIALEADDIGKSVPVEITKKEES